MPSNTADTGAEVTRRPYVNSPPQAGRYVASKQEADAEFGRRLQAKMVEKGWSQSDLSRAASKYMPGSKTIPRDNISNYVRGLQFPGPVRLRALCSALGVAQEELVPAGAVASVDDRSPPMEMRMQPDGNVYLRINQVMTLEAATQILDIIKKDQGRKA